MRELGQKYQIAEKMAVNWTSTLSRLETKYPQKTSGVSLSCGLVFT